MFAQNYFFYKITDLAMIFVTAVRPEKGAKAFRNTDIRQPTGGSKNHVSRYRNFIQHIPSIRWRHSRFHLLRSRITWNHGGLYWNAKSQEGPELLQGLAMSTALEADCWTIHQKPACREHAQAEQVIVAALSHNRRPTCSHILLFY